MSDPRNNLIVALANACSTAINETDITVTGVLEACCTTIAWVIANTDPEHHENIRRNLAAAVPQMLRIGRDAQDRLESRIQ